MHILLTNDDGIHAPGMSALYNLLADFADVTVVAPHICQSGQSHSITLRPIVCEKVTTEYFTGYAIEGSPADCVKLAVRELVDRHIDMVVSGINIGANVGINVRYSGTVAAAAEAAIQNLPAAALSAATGPDGIVADIKKCCRLGVDVLKRIMPLQPGDIVNINIPRTAEPKGVRVADQSNIPYIEKYETIEKNNGRVVFQITGQPPYSGAPPHDTAYLEEGYITVTSLHNNMTDYNKNRVLREIDFNCKGSENAR